MIYPGNFIQVMQDMFHGSASSSTSMVLQLDKHSLYSKNLVVNLDNKELPILCIDAFRGKYTHETVLPLYQKRETLNKRTFNSALKVLFSGDYTDGLVKVVTNKGEIYYGGRGLILDEHFNPVIMFTVRFISEFTYDKIICRINPKVFLEPDKLIHKGIIKYIIPYMGEYTVPLWINRVYLNSRSSQVIIENFNDWFVSPTKPEPSESINDSLNECLVDSIEDVINVIKC